MCFFSKQATAQRPASSPRTEEENAKLRTPLRARTHTHTRTHTFSLTRARAHNLAECWKPLRELGVLRRGYRMMSTTQASKDSPAEVSQSFSKEQSGYRPLLAGEERKDPSYSGVDFAQTLAEMEETLTMMEMKYASFVRHDIYGPMGTGHFSLLEKARLVVALLFFVPMKVMLLLMIAISYYIICSFCTMFRAPDQNGIEVTHTESSISPSKTDGKTNGAEENGSDALAGSQESYAHLTGLRRFVIAELGRFLSRMVLFVLGFYWIKVSRKDKEQDERLLKARMILLKTDLRPGAIISNHVSYLDIFYYMSAAFPSFVAKRSIAKLPIVGLVSKCLGCVYVQREDKPSDGKGVAGIIKKRTQASAEDTNAPSMMLFPEGTTTNGFYLLPFKTGAFLAGTPVRPVILKYSYKRFSPAWDSISGVRHFVLLLCQFINFMEVIWLPVYIPSEKEKSDPKLYASNVRSLMVVEGGLLKSEIGLKEKRIYHSFLDEYLALKGAA
ncbi:hypothetical protein L7F22_041539 [Adiantum nelumboides]|nr:hypothetical protein [Adiantum nelumboides]